MWPRYGPRLDDEELVLPSWTVDEPDEHVEAKDFFGLARGPCTVQLNSRSAPDTLDMSCVVGEEDILRSQPRRSSAASPPASGASIEAVLRVSTSAQIAIVVGTAHENVDEQGQLRNSVAERQRDKLDASGQV